MVTRSKLDRRSTLLAALVLALVGVIASAAGARAAVSVLHSFPPARTRCNPKAPLIRASDGMFYGTTESGGAFNLGTVFKMAPNGTVTLLHAFASSSDGASPVAALVQGMDGNFYGTTPTGGSSGSRHGVQDHTGRHRDDPACVHRRSRRRESDGLADSGIGRQLLRDDAVRRFGEPGNGVQDDSRPASLTVLRSFTGGADGADPAGSLVQATDGNLYGTTVGGGGAAGAGTVFRLTTGGVLR